LRFVSEEIGEADWIVRLTRDEFETLTPFAASIEQEYPAGCLERDHGLALDWKAVLHARRLMRKVDSDWGEERTVEPARSVMRRADEEGRVLTVIS
jgi:hypothetical protein